MVSKELIKPLFVAQKELSTKLTNVNNAIRALQDVCDHDFQPDGHDSHKDHYKCSICSWEESW